MPALDESSVRTWWGRFPSTGTTVQGLELNEDWTIDRGNDTGAINTVIRFGRLLDKLGQRALPQMLSSEHLPKTRITLGYLGARRRLMLVHWLIEQRPAALARLLSPQEPVTVPLEAHAIRVVAASLKAMHRRRELEKLFDHRRLMHVLSAIQDEDYGDED